MQLKDYFTRESKGEPQQGSKGIQTDWLDFCEMILTGSRFLVVDANFVPSADDGVLIEASAGKYRVQAKAIDFGGDKRIARLRTFLEGASPSLGAQLGETWTDTAMTGICDFEVFSKAWGANNDGSYEKIRPAIEEADSLGIAVLDETVGAAMPFVHSGFGDGSFPVYELVAGGSRVGLEIQFIAEDEPYPFGERSATPSSLAELHRVAAEQGNPDAQWELGKLYQKGEGVEENLGEAVKWYVLAAENGSIKAANHLGALYQKGMGVPKDESKAAAYYLEAAEKGYAKAQFNIGLFYSKGIGVPRSDEQAVKWYRLAAEQLYDRALCNLGHCYLDGTGVPQDHQQAVRSFGLAAAQDHAISQNNLGHCYETGQGVEQDFGTAAFWYRKAAEQGVLSAQKSLGVLLKNGKGVAKDLDNVLMWFHRAAEKGFPEAEYQLALLYEAGEGVKENRVEACKWFRRAAEKGEVEAARRLAELMARLTEAERAAIDLQREFSR